MEYPEVLTEKLILVDLDITLPSTDFSFDFPSNIERRKYPALAIG